MIATQQPTHVRRHTSQNFQPVDMLAMRIMLDNWLVGSCRETRIMQNFTSKMKNQSKDRIRYDSWLHDS